MQIIIACRPIRLIIVTISPLPSSSSFFLLAVWGIGRINKQGKREKCNRQEREEKERERQRANVGIGDPINSPFLRGRLSPSRGGRYRRWQCFSRHRRNSSPDSGGKVCAFPTAQPPFSPFAHLLFLFARYRERFRITE